MRKKPVTRKRFTVQERARLLARFRENRITQRAFAAQIGISVSCLRNWLREDSQSAFSEPKKTAASFVEINPGAFGTSRPQAALTVRFPGGLVVEAASSCGIESLGALCQVLSRL